MSEFSNERTLIVIKPDGIQRSLVGEIIKRFEQVGLKLVACKFFIPTPDFIDKHYNLDSSWKKNVGEKAIEAYAKKGMEPPTSDPLKAGEKVINGLKKYISSGPVLAVALQGAHAVELVRKMIGGTEPLSSDVGTIRGDYVLDSYQMADTDGRAVRNLIHASGSVSEAIDELGLWFSEDEIIDYTLVQESILYDVNIDGRPE